MGETSARRAETLHVIGPNIEKKGTFIILQVIRCLTITVEYLGLSRHARM